MGGNVLLKRLYYRLLSALLSTGSYGHKEEDQLTEFGVVE